MDSNLGTISIVQWQKILNTIELRPCTKAMSRQRCYVNEISTLLLKT